MPATRTLHEFPPKSSRRFLASFDCGPKNEKTQNPREQSESESFPYASFIYLNPRLPWREFVIGQKWRTPFRKSCRSTAFRGFVFVIDLTVTSKGNCFTAFNFEPAHRRSSLSTWAAQDASGRNFIPQCDLTRYCNRTRVYSCKGATVCQKPCWLFSQQPAESGIAVLRDCG